MSPIVRPFLSRIASRVLCAAMALGAALAPLTQPARAADAFPNKPIRIVVPFLSLIHISEPTRPLYISYAVFCLKKKRG